MQAGDTISFQLLRRPRHSIIPAEVGKQQPSKQDIKVRFIPVLLCTQTKYVDSARQMLIMGWARSSCHLPPHEALDHT